MKTKIQQWEDYFDDDFYARERTQSVERFDEELDAHF